MRFSKPSVPALQTATIFPGMIFSLLVIVNMFVARQRSSSAIPITTFLSFFGLWFGISLPLVLAGAYFGQKKKVRALLGTTRRVRAWPSC